MKHTINRRPDVRVLTSNSMRWYLGICAAVGFYALYFARLGSCPLIDPDEPVYGQVAKEMAAGAGWLTPHKGGLMWFDKPPLFYWLSGICARLLGPNELASRLPSAVLAVALVLLVYALATYDFGKRAGVLSAVVMATCLQQIVLARAAVTDMTLTFCLIAALYAYRRWLDALGRDRFAWIVLCGVMTGLGTLTKGPVAPVLLFGTFVLHLWWIGRLKRLLRLDAVLGVAAALIVGLPWFVLMYVMHGQAFVQGFLVANNVTRFVKAEHATQTGMWYAHFVNLPYVFVFFFPWSMFLPWAIRRTWKLNQGAKLACVWAAVVFVFFSISKTVLITYIFPLYPAAAVLVGSFLCQAASKDSGAVRELRCGHYLILGMSCLLAVGLAILAHKKYPDAGTAALILGLILVAFSLASVLWIHFRPESPGRSVWITGAGMTIFALWLMIGVLGHVESRLSTRDLVRQIPISEHTQIAQIYVDKPSLRFYVGSRLVDAGNDSSAMALLSSKEPAFVFCETGKENLIRAPGSFVWARSTGVEVLASASAASLKGSKRVD